jgi:nucleotide-binding universal stress UspA family protein
MLPITKILHPTDFSPHSAPALEFACALARDYGANLVLVYVRQPQVAPFGEFGPVAMEPVVPLETLKGRLRQLPPNTFPGHVECHVREGDAAAEILALAEECGCDVIVMGTHGRTGLGRLLMGSVAEHVVRKAPCAVLTVKAPLPEHLETKETAAEELAKV